MNDTFLFADDMPEEEDSFDYKWNVLVIDDEPEIHNITKIVLNDLVFDDGRLALHSAYTATEAKNIISNSQHDFAVAIVDVVMETVHAGLDFVKWVREDLNNHKIRLFLRTGQPGEAPEESVIREYDINDYKNKTELTALRLKTSVYSALRGYRDILTIEKHRIGLEKIIAASSEFIECDTLPQFGSAILKQVAVVLGIEEEAVICCAVAKDANNNLSNVHILALNQPQPVQIETPLSLSSEVNARIKRALALKHSIYEEDYFIGYFTTKRNTENVLYVAQNKQLEPMQHRLLEFFANNIAVAHENLKLRDVIKDSQKELSYIIGEAVEMRSKETGSHVKRVAQTSYMLAKLYGLDDFDSEMIKLASPLHDVGKVGIPDYVLNKPDKLDSLEWEVMQTHAQIGFEMLARTDNPILQLGATIARQHHEKWDGTGYPQGLQGEEIAIAGRITALMDVFDALGSKRCYKKPWANQEIIDFLKEQRGKAFEPKLVDLLLTNISQFNQVREQYPDKF
ncbi:MULTISPECIES: DUF3369 domain-containing protein [Aliiglaciecola]|uniref:DUF3369 domain-containing protein n=1 Tax=Aliiglaciecola TaxID=1406885 RepID=UPI001C09CE66|nr:MULTISPECIES: DUF3369 domain-containing protein [Aliiglaciecola]MBU2878861.1 DUF3369 domain-containing protein [Aliiglaciecola lipolytica]MDO6711240.1 DUF3369 domain-containing protein [Aliiglaciecola sp. 2_MG-2023]MDO6752311.1 DUF3369 domain-containing protein [Aliiglaciecola sp. 1_MG-2023]